MNNKSESNLNDVEQGSVEGLGFVLGGTHEFLHAPGADCLATRRCNRGWRITRLPGVIWWT